MTLLGTKTRSQRLALVGTVILGIPLLCAVAAPWLAPYDPTERVTRPFSKPSAEHLLGADDVGHDLLSMLIHGAQISLFVGVVAALVATTIGTVVGIAAGYLRGATDAILMRVVDVILSLPVLPLTIVIGVFAGPGLTTQITVISAVLWAGLARELRSQVLTLRERDYIQAERAMGAGPLYVLRRHILPAIFPLVIPQFVLTVKTAILLEASLAFLGLGDISAASWGSMLSMAHARNAFLTDAWVWWVLPPGIAIAVTVLGFALLGNAIEERSRPVLTRARSRLRRKTRPVDIPVTEENPTAPLIVDDLTVVYGENGRGATNVSFTVAPGELVGLVGESGSGKSTVAAATIGLLPSAAQITSGRILVSGRDVATLSKDEFREIRGNRISLIPQEALSALNPVRTIGSQLDEAIRTHRRCTRREARDRTAELLTQVGLGADRADSYPHQLSGGMRQRVVIAMALANEPDVVIADEPTSGLDVLREAEVLALLDDLRTRYSLALLIVTHNLPVIERIADRIAVMKDGDLVEIGTASQISTDPQHSYTRTLVESAPRLDFLREEVVR
ncbi:dipeptide/oligopeptide/nickel ABC transporter permease/ATP-binding protein [Rhodococcus sp. HNM0563]|uniref:dipeptide/oligopeptide/nickel ABC transporter permease/ATP-binding protein n=1 Tax=unclassified Rhodococcus (in: high G+C Gram-positive bacteria) TaxID=192944 RepID=UPI00146A4FE6|nr:MULTISPECIES: dipeptide/oligopeptide/nickel ABC transporter permease/ATP-binding protein [unclassified Rhodococcus (in: high G+C Gram-positive bacteria)]MCK0093381.1 dipeptide/oligopeptide/nickel ABC transporter permease/ATP-binding protein [Rhodococcus sp. F64268]NLU60782.1 dipeptide/oligopeptide/nickel ABC transporter permease/ATP-binding protein [Rhodococcus sp. HNM0563]